MSNSFDGDDSSDEELYDDMAMPFNDDEGDYGDVAMAMPAPRLAKRTPMCGRGLIGSGAPVHDGNAGKAFTSGDALLDLIALQQFDGSWDSGATGFFELVLAAAGIDGNDAEKRCRDFCASEGPPRATALAIAAIQIGQASRREEWAMIKEKAVDWLEENAACANVAAELIEAAEKALKGSRA